MYEDFKRFGRELFLQGLNSSHSGNMSVRVADRILITRRGSMLANLTESDIIETGLEKDDSNVMLASTEIGVHRAIYKATSALSIIHCHPPYGMALSLLYDKIVPVDAEGIYYLHRIPVIAARLTVGSEEVEKILPPVLRDYRAILLRGHGAFCIGEMLEEAYQYASALAVATRIVYLTRLLNKDWLESKMDEAGKW